MKIYFYCAKLQTSHLRSKKNKMQNLFWLILVILLFHSCGHGKDKFSQNISVDKIVINPRLLTNLTEFMDYQDSSKCDNKSYLITFSKIDNKCYVEIKCSFDYYDSKAMNGYFMYKGHSVSVYGMKTNCGMKLINQTNLIQGKIEGLLDYDMSPYENIEKNEIIPPPPPPPPPPPGEPSYRKYIIVDDFILILVDKFSWCIERNKG